MFRRAEEAIADAIDLAPRDPGILAFVHVSRGFSLATLFRVDEAITDLETALGVLPPDHELTPFVEGLLADLVAFAD